MAFCSDPEGKTPGLISTFPIHDKDHPHADLVEIQPQLMTGPNFASTPESTTVTSNEAIREFAEVINNTETVLRRYLRTVPGIEFANRQIKYLNMRFVSLVPNSLPEETGRFTQSLKNLITKFIEEGAPEYFFYNVCGIINEFTREPTDPNPELS
jgi:hypothetical protein